MVQSDGSGRTATTASGGRVVVAEEAGDQVGQRRGLDQAAHWIAPDADVDLPVTNLEVVSADGDLLLGGDYVRAADVRHVVGRLRAELVAAQAALADALGRAVRAQAVPEVVLPWRLGDTVEVGRGGVAHPSVVVRVRGEACNLNRRDAASMADALRASVEPAAVVSTVEVSEGAFDGRRDEGPTDLGRDLRSGRRETPVLRTRSMTTDPNPLLPKPPKPFTRGFRIEFPDGFHVDGAQFPSGRVVLDDAKTGLIEAAVSLDDLATLRGRPLAEVVWADGGGRDVCSCPTLDVSTIANRDATARGLDPACPIHGGDRS